ncbi:holo-[acyl-carrier-protein] synthase [Spiroplasma sp. TIUS-1]|uniref:holo-ACP synthase n=1 Tax=Spiroplasma sp. TIUS-1 TaxID=216963 RepID=UPI001398B0A3|nr:4'-phosphopantetheinyl transferase superfamily protein [Spiroplasma sp. TIUS-1]QHX35988.1 holo-[acyl-carrier-protein] synthase [Spiroplasma sp. TIUS-1]
MIKSGIDIIQVNRVSLEDSFVRKVLHEEEINMLNLKISVDEKKQFLAGRWAAKEAIFKAQNHTIGYNKFNIKLIDGQLKVESELKVNISLSISHEKEYAVALALVE